MARLGNICLAVLVCAAFCYSIADAQNATGVIAMYTRYDPPKHNWSLYEVDVACADRCGAQPLDWRQKYGWTAFCGPEGPEGQDACGKCLNVTNTKTKAHLIARIVDTCGMGGLDMDHDELFHPLDADGSGELLGHLVVDYEFVDCGDDCEDCTGCTN